MDSSHQAPLSMGFSKQEYWSGLPFPSPGDLPNPGMEPWSCALQADSLPSGPPGRPICLLKHILILFSFLKDNLLILPAFLKDDLLDILF